MTQLLGYVGGGAKALPLFFDSEAPDNAQFAD
jgi:hypothetical protein